MTQDALKRSLFPFSLSGKASIWYRCFGSDHSTWKCLRTTFCIRFFSLRHIIALRMVLSFKWGKVESLGMAWNHFASLVETCPVVSLPNLVLLQHFWVGLLEGSAMNMKVDPLQFTLIISRRAFLSCASSQRWELPLLEHLPRAKPHHLCELPS
jgi:hypothetical protein